MRDELKGRLDQYVTLRIGMLAEKIVEEQYALQSAFWKPYGSEGRKLSVRDAGYHIPFLVEAILASDPGIFNNYILWVKKLFKGLNFPEEILITTLECTRKVLKNEVPDDISALTDAYIGRGLEEVRKPVGTDEPFINTKSPLGVLASAYINALLEGDRHKASRMILAEAEKGTSIKSIYLEVFQKTQYEIGRLWLENRIGIAQEHYCSAATQVIMSQLYPYIFSGERIGHSIVTACVGGELHELGIRMVTDFFEMDGWDSYYLGANTPSSAILKAIRDYKADVLGLSVSMPNHISLLRETIEIIRSTGEGKNLIILIGGNAINNSNLRHEYFKANGFARNAGQAVELANQLISDKR